jgi:hypothetical protein
MAFVHLGCAGIRHRGHLCDSCQRVGAARDVLALTTSGDRKGLAFMAELAQLVVVKSIAVLWNRTDDKARIAEI